MRTLWIAGLGAVLISGGVAAQGMTTLHGAAVDRHGAAMPRVTDSPFQRQPGDAPDTALRAQDPRLNQGRLPTAQGTQAAPVPSALQASPAQPTPDRTLSQQDPRLRQDRGTARQNVTGGSGAGMRGESMPRRQASGTVGTYGRADAPRNPADRAYMGGGMILENGRPVPLPGDPPGMASDFRADAVPQSTATGRTGGLGMGDMTTDGPRGPQTNVGQTGVRDQGMVGTPQGAFPANPGTPGGRVPTGN
ncbi:MAG TPA: hypothetical protein VGN96_17585 [Roseococcus sp.]|jgi:hypothetical protein|nr:hypothetical protein [Roseococcus sp.]